MDGSDFDSSVISFTITTLKLCYSDIFEWILDMNTTYHVFSKRDSFPGFDKLDDDLVQMNDDSTCRMD